jgi:hypothetical protein
MVKYDGSTTNELHAPGRLDHWLGRQSCLPIPVDLCRRYQCIAGTRPFKPQYSAAKAYDQIYHIGDCLAQCIVSVQLLDAVENVDVAQYWRANRFACGRVRNVKCAGLRQIRSRKLVQVRIAFEILLVNKQAEQSCKHQLRQMLRDNATVRIEIQLNKTESV